MSTETMISIFVVVAVAAISTWARKRPNRAKDNPDRVRMPKVMGFFGWLLIAAGALMSMAALFASNTSPGPVIAGLVMVLVGAGVLAMYRNFYISAGEFELVFRSVLGKEKVIPYREVTEYSVQPLRGQRMLSVKSERGVKLTINIDAYDLSPLLRAIDFHRATGRWPVPAGTSPVDS